MVYKFLPVKKSHFSIRAKNSHIVLIRHTVDDPVYMSLECDVFATYIKQPGKRLCAQNSGSVCIRLVFEPHNYPQPGVTSDDLNSAWTNIFASGESPCQDDARLTKREGSAQVRHQG